MYVLAYQYPVIFSNYTDWIRLHVVIWYAYCSETATSYDLIWTSVVGSFFASHFLYILTGYKLLDDLQSEFFIYKIGYAERNRLLYLVNDFSIQAIPLIFVYGITHESPCLVPSSYTWIITGIQQLLFPLVITGKWDMHPLYGVSLTEYNIKNTTVVRCVLSGHLTAYIVLKVLLNIV